MAVSQFADFTEKLSNMAVSEPFHLREYKNSQDEKIIKYAPVIDLTLDELDDSIIMEDSTVDLLERLVVSSILVCKGEGTVEAEQLGKSMVRRYYQRFGEVDEPAVGPVTDMLIYNYDYGDGWSVDITRMNDCDDLIENGFLTNSELDEALDSVIEKHKPVCIHQDGMFVMDDVGGFGGFIRLLQIINKPDGIDDSDEIDETESKEYTKRWAYSMGWSTRKVSNKQML